MAQWPGRAGVSIRSYSSIRQKLWLLKAISVSLLARSAFGIGPPPKDGGWKQCRTPTVWNAYSKAAPCVLPFTYAGKTYNDCTDLWPIPYPGNESYASLLSEGDLWCVTQAGDESTALDDRWKTIAKCSPCLDVVGRVGQQDSIMATMLTDDFEVLKSPLSLKVSQMTELTRPNKRIKIGLLSPIADAGMRKYLGPVVIGAERERYNGFELFFEHVRDIGGIKINGEMHSLEIVDLFGLVVPPIPFPYLQEQTRETFRYLVREKNVSLFLGPGTFADRDVIPIAAELGAIFLTSFSFDGAEQAHSAAWAETALQNQKSTPTVFRTWPSASDSMETIVQAWMETCAAVSSQSCDLSKTTSLMIQKNEGDSNGPCASWRKQMIEAGAPMSQLLDYDISQPLDDFLQAHAVNGPFRPDFAIICNVGDGPGAVECSDLSNRLFQRDIEPKFVVTVGCTSPWVFSVQAQPWDPIVDFTDSDLQYSSNDFRRDHFARFGSLPTSSSSAAFATASILALALIAAQATDTYSVSKVLRERTFETVFGPVAFDSEGYVVKNMSVRQIINASGYGVDVYPKTIRENRMLWPKPSERTIDCLVAPGVTAAGMYRNKGMIDTTASADCVLCPSGMVGNMSTGNESEFSILQLPRYICSPCPRGTRETAYADNSKDCAKCLPGTYSDVEGSGSCVSCAAGFYQPESGSSACRNCVPGKFVPVGASTVCYDCMDKSKQTTLYSDDVVLYTSLDASTECEICPPGAVCKADERGLQIGYVAQEGYYLMPVVADARGRAVVQELGFQLGEIFSCPYYVSVMDSTCLGDGRCTDGMEGPLCGTCKNGYGKVTDHQSCEVCPQMKFLYLAINILVFLIVGNALALLLMPLNPSRPSSILVPLARQTLNYLMLMSLLTPELHISLFEQYTLDQIFHYLYVSSGIRGPQLSVVAFDCLVREYLPSFDTYKVYVMVAFLIWPAIIIVDMFVINVVRLVLHVPHWYEHALMWIHTYLIHFRLLSLLRPSMICILRDGQRLVWDPSILCADDERVFWRNITVVALILFGIGIPITIQCRLFYLNRRGSLWQESNVRSLGIFVLGLKPTLYYWECVCMGRKVFLLLVTLFQMPKEESGDGLAQSELSVVLIVAIAYLLVYQYLRPYTDECYSALDKVENILMWCFVSQLMFQLWISVTEGLAWNQSQGDLSWLQGDPGRSHGIRDDFLFILILIIYLKFKAVVSWAIKLDLSKQHAGFTEEFQMGMHGFSTRNLDKRALDMFEKAMMMLVQVTLHTNNMCFNPSKFKELLIHVFADAYYWKCLETQHTASAAYTEHVRHLHAEIRQSERLELDMFLTSHAMAEVEQILAQLHISSLDMMVSRKQEVEDALTREGMRPTDSQASAFTKGEIQRWREDTKERFDQMMGEVFLERADQLITEARRHKITRSDLEDMSPLQNAFSIMNAKDRCACLTALCIEGELRFSPLVTRQLVSQRLSVHDFYASAVRYARNGSLTKRIANTRTALRISEFCKPYVSEPADAKSSKGREGLSIFQETGMPTTTIFEEETALSTITKCKYLCECRSYTGFVVGDRKVFFTKAPHLEIRSVLSHQKNHTTYLYSDYGQRASIATQHADHDYPKPEEMMSDEDLVFLSNWVAKEHKEMDSVLEELGVAWRKLKLTNEQAKTFERVGLYRKFFEVNDLILRGQLGVAGALGDDTKQALQKAIAAVQQAKSRRGFESDCILLEDALQEPGKSNLVNRILRTHGWTGKDFLMPPTLHVLLEDLLKAQEAHFEDQKVHEVHELLDFYRGSSTFGADDEANTAVPEKEVGTPGVLTKAEEEEFRQLEEEHFHKAETASESIESEDEKELQKAEAEIRHLEAQLEERKDEASKLELEIEALHSRLN